MEGPYIGKKNVLPSQVSSAVSSSFHISLSSDPADVLGMYFPKCKVAASTISKKSHCIGKLSLGELVHSPVNMSAPLKIFHIVMFLAHKKPDFTKWCIDLVQISQASISSVHWPQDMSPFNLQVSSKNNYCELLIMQTMCDVFRNRLNFLKFRFATIHNVLMYFRHAIQNIRKII